MSYLAQAIGELKSQIHAYLQQSTNELVRFQVKLDKVICWLGWKVNLRIHNFIYIFEMKQKH